MPIYDRLEKVQLLDLRGPFVKSKVNKPRPPDDEKTQVNVARNYPKLANINEHGNKKHVRNENDVSNDDTKSGSFRSWRDGLLLSGITKRQIPSQIGQVEAFSECDFTQHDPQCQSVLDISFPSNGNPTLGLPRAVAPDDSELERYANLVDNSIPDHMVAPISKMMVDGTHRNVPKQLTEHFKGVLKILDEVSLRNQ